MAPIITIGSGRAKNIIGESKARIMDLLIPLDPFSNRLK